MRENGVVALHLPIGSLKTYSVLVRKNRDANPIPTNPLADDLATAPENGAVINKELYELKARTSLCGVLSNFADILILYRCLFSCL